MDCPFKPGDKVRVKASIPYPRYGWGSASHSSVGTVAGNRFGLYVDFPNNPGWVADWTQMELVERVYGNEED